MKFVNVLYYFILLNPITAAPISPIYCDKSEVLIFTLKLLKLPILDVLKRDFYNIH